MEKRVGFQTIKIENLRLLAPDSRCKILTIIFLYINIIFLHRLEKCHITVLGMLSLKIQKLISRKLQKKVT